MRAPAGTSIVDIADPGHPRLLARLEMPPGAHSHKVRVDNRLMLINRERNHADNNAPPENFRGGLGIYDVTKPARPREITRWETDGMGVHRFDFDGRHAYISPTVEGYRGNIVMILDLGDPAHPREVGRWWMPHGAPLPSSAAPGRPALYQLLAWRLRHPRHRRHGKTTPRLFVRLEPAIRLSDAYDLAAAVQSNDVTTDDRGLFYLLDRLRGLTILGRCSSAFRYVEPALVLTALFGSLEARQALTGSGGIAVSNLFFAEPSADRDISRRTSRARFVRSPGQVRNDYCACACRHIAEDDQVIPRQSQLDRASPVSSKKARDIADADHTPLRRFVGRIVGILPDPTRRGGPT
jgi:hypothetical protein